MAIARICRLQWSPKTQRPPAFISHNIYLNFANNTKNKTKMCVLYVCMSVCICSVIFCLILCIICKKSIPTCEKLWSVSCKSSQLRDDTLVSCPCGGATCCLSELWIITGASEGRAPTPALRG